MRLLFAAITLLAHFSPYAQTCEIKKGYAYHRATIPGNIPRRDLDENGKEIDRPIKMMNTLFIFVETDKKCSLQVTKLWIAGKAYHVKQEELKELPIVIYHSHPGTPPDTLVKSTNNKVFRIQPAGDWSNDDKKVEGKNNEPKIVIEYVRRKRTTTYKIDQVKRIAPVVLQ